MTVSVGAVYRLRFLDSNQAWVAKLADAPDLKSGAPQGA
jgi:hypothetical protein